MKKSSLSRSVPVWILAFLFVFETTAFAGIIRVKPDGNDANSGASWALAKKTVQAAVNSANEGDEIWVAAGTYAEHIKNRVLNQATDPQPINVALYGGFAGSEAERDKRNWAANLTILEVSGFRFCRTVFSLFSVFRGPRIFRPRPSSDFPWSRCCRDKDGG